MSERAVIDGALLVLLSCAAIVIAIPVTVLRPPIVLASALLVPGAAVLTRLEIEDPVVGGALAIALSIAIDVLGSLALVWTGWWHPGVLAVTLGAGATVLLVDDMRRSFIAGRRGRAAVEAEHDPVPFGGPPTAPVPAAQAGEGARAVVEPLKRRWHGELVPQVAVGGLLVLTLVLVRWRRARR